MKTYRFDVKVTGFLLMNARAETEEAAKKLAYAKFEKRREKSLEVDDLSYVKIAAQLLSVDGEEA